MPSKISQSQKDKYCLIPLNKVPRVVKFTETRNWLLGAGGW